MKERVEYVLTIGNQLAGEARAAATSVDSLSSAATAGLRAVGGLAAGALAAGAAFAGLANNMFNTVDQINTLAQASGLSTDTVAGLRLAASAANKSLEQLVPSELTMHMLDAAHGSKDMSDAFKAAGVSVKDSNGHLRDVNVLLPALIGNLLKIPDPTARAALATKTMGEAGKQMLSAFSDQGQLQQFIDGAKEFGIHARIAQQQSDAWWKATSNLKLALEDAGATLVSAFADTASEGMNHFALGLIFITALIQELPTVAKKSTEALSSQFSSMAADIDRRFKGTPDASGGIKLSPEQQKRLADNLNHATDGAALHAGKSFGTAIGDATSDAMDDAIANATAKAKEFYDAFQASGAGGGGGGGGGGAPSFTPAPTVTIPDTAEGWAKLTAAKNELIDYSKLTAQQSHALELLAKQIVAEGNSAMDQQSRRDAGMAVVDALNANSEAWNKNTFDLIKEMQKDAADRKAEADRQAKAAAAGAATSSIISTLQGGLSDAISKGFAAITPTGDPVTAVVMQLLGVINDLPDMLMNTFMNVFNFVEELPHTIVRLVAELPTKLATLAPQLTAAIAFAAPRLIDAFLHSIPALVGALIKIGPQLGIDMAKMFIDLFKDFFSVSFWRDLGTQLYESIKQAISDAFAGLKKAGHDLGSTLTFGLFDKRKGANSHAQAGPSSSYFDTEQDSGPRSPRPGGSKGNTNERQSGGGMHMHGVTIVANNPRDLFRQLRELGGAYGLNESTTTWG